jgi:hypothetical protein
LSRENATKEAGRRKPMGNSGKINLLQMQKYFEGQMKSVRTISDLELSENDYRGLSTRLKSLCFFTGSENDIEDFMLSIVVHSAYSLIYGDVGKSFETIVWMVMNNSQYMERMHLHMFRDVFHDYGLNTFDIEDPDILAACRKLSAAHAGVPNAEKTMYYDIISEHLGAEDIGTLIAAVTEMLPERSRYIFGLMDETARQRFILDSRAMVSDVIDGMLRRSELVERYPALSYSLIDRCLIWNENNNQRIRFRI